MLLDNKLVLGPCIHKHITNQAAETHTHTQPHAHKTIIAGVVVGESRADNPIIH